MRRSLVLAVATLLGGAAQPAVAAPLRAQGLLERVERASAAEDSAGHREAARRWRLVWDVAEGDHVPLYLVARNAAKAGDQAGRAGIDSILRRFGVPSPQADAAIARMTAIDTAVQARLRAIVAARGWPGRRLVGDEAAHAAWLVTQHMDDAEQRALLPRLQAAARRGDARAADVALLEDRVLTNGGRAQHYGSQLRPPKPGAAPELFPIDRPECVDQRRAAVQLAPLASYLATMGATWSAPAGARCDEPRRSRP